MKERIMEINKFEAIESLGHLLAYYKSDLEYIAQFRLFIINKTSSDDYLTMENSGFQKFLNDFKVARNIKKEKVKDLMILIKNSKFLEDAKNVDSFAEEMKKEKITHDNKVMTVLASKIFFLYQPEKVIPMDKFNKISLGLKENSYSDFLIEVNKFIKEHKKILFLYLKKMTDCLIKIENSVNIKMDFEEYRIKRFTDKYLWVTGRNYKPSKKNSR